MEDRRVIAEHAPGRGDIVVIRFNRPEKLNALDLAMWARLASLVENACSSEAKGVIITGTGRAFSSGDDIKAMLSLNTIDEAISFFKTLANAMESIALCQKPVTAAVNGIAAGGGAEMLLLMDYVVAVEDAMIGYPEIRLGLIPPLLATIGSSILGMKTARRLALTGGWLTVEEAKNLGIVDEIVESPLEAAVKAIDKLTGHSEHATHAIKRLQYTMLKPVIDEAITELARLVLTKEAKQLMTAFIESRKTRRKQEQ